MRQDEQNYYDVHVKYAWKLAIVQRKLVKMIGTSLVTINLNVLQFLFYIGR